MRPPHTLPADIHDLSGYGRRFVFRDFRRQRRRAAVRQLFPGSLQ